MSLINYWLPVGAKLSAEEGAGFIS